MFQVVSCVCWLVWSLVVHSYCLEEGSEHVAPNTVMVSCMWFMGVVPHIFAVMLKYCDINDLEHKVGHNFNNNT